MMKKLKGPQLPIRLLWPPITFLIFGLLVTTGATLTMAETSRARSALRFATHVAETRAAIDERVQVHVALLRGVAGLFSSGVPVDQDTFQRYIKKLDLEVNYPGVQGVGFSALVRPEARDTLIATVRSWGNPAFTIWPDTPRDEYHSIILLEPRDRRNLRAIGFDMFSEATRREAMMRARDTGFAARSGAVELVQEIDEQKQSGFLIYLPVYQGGAIPDTIAERRAKLIGFAYSPFRAGDLFTEVLDIAGRVPIAYTIYDGTSMAPEALIYRSPHLGGPGYRPAFTTSELVSAAGRQWTIVYSSQPSFDATGDAYVAPIAAVAGVALTLMLFGVAWAQARARYEAELAVKARETFLSVASHELKTPLTSLFGNAQLLQRRIDRGNSIGDRERANINTIVEQSRRLNKLIDDLLDHSRLQEGRLVIDRQLLDLNALVQRVTDDLRPTLSKHNLAVTLPDKPLLVLGDEIRLDQVLLNLISNAVKYSPNGGPVRVVVSRTGSWAMVTIADRGIGIPAPAMAQLFSPFYRAENAVHKQIGGMGIGLYVVKELVERHGGTMAVESEEGVGSTFTVCLPVADPQTDATVTPHTPDAPLPRQL